MPPGLGQAEQLPEQLRALHSKHTVERFGMACLNGRHQLEEEVVTVAAQPWARFAQAPVQLGPADDILLTRGYPVDDVIRRVGQLG